MLQKNLVPVNRSEEGGTVVSTEWLLHKNKFFKKKEKRKRLHMHWLYLACWFYIEA